MSSGSTFATRTRHRVRVVLAAIGPAVFCALLLVGLLLVGMSQPIPAVAVPILLGIIIALGSDRAGTLFMVLAVLFAPMNSVRAVLGAGSITLSDVFFVMGTGLLLPVMVKNKYRAPSLFIGASSVALVIGTLSALAGDEPVLSLVSLVRVLLAWFVIPSIFILWRPNLRLLHVMACAYVLGQVISVAYSFVDPVQRPLPRNYGLTTHVNNYGLAALLAFTLVPFAASMAPRAWRPAVWFSGLICLFGVWDSGSRAALLSAVAAFLVYMVVERSGKAVALTAFMGTMGLVFLSRILAADPASALGRLFGGQASANSDNQRAGLLNEGWGRFIERPVFGWGFNGVRDYHNVYLGIAVSVGVIGLVAMLAILWSAVQPLFVAPKPYRLLCYAAGAYAVCAGLSTNVWDRFVWILIAMVFAMRNTWADDESDSTLWQDPADSPTDGAEPDRGGRRSASPSIRRAAGLRIQ